MQSTEAKGEHEPGVEPGELHGQHLRTVEALFRHPTAHNLEWADVVGLMEKIGAVTRLGNDRFGLVVGGEHYLLHKPHTKDLPSAEVVELRHLLTRAGWAPGRPPVRVDAAKRQEPTLVVVVDQKGARIYRIDVAIGRSTGSQISPYSPHHFSRHLAHTDQSTEERQRAAEDPVFYKRISQALASAGRIVVVGHGTGNSNAGKQLTPYLQTHHPETHQCVVSELDADLSAITTPQLLELAEQALGRRA